MIEEANLQPGGRFHGPATVLHVCPLVDTTLAVRDGIVLAPAQRGGRERIDPSCLAEKRAAE